MFPTSFSLQAPLPAKAGRLSHERPGDPPATQTPRLWSFRRPAPPSRPGWAGRGAARSAAYVRPLPSNRPLRDPYLRPVRYSVAASLDGYIAAPDGGYDWIPPDPAVDFAALFAKVDTVLLGRRTYETVRAAGPGRWFAAATRVYVFSTTLSPTKHPGVTLVAADAAQVVAGLRAEPGDAEIWLFGGGELFRSLLAARQVDRVEVTVVPVLLGGGIPLSRPGAPRTKLALVETTRYPSGKVTLSYNVLDRAG
jgi:dihydrofolate reductase